MARFIEIGKNVANQATVNECWKDLKDKEEYADFLSMTKALKEELSVIENNIHMTKNQSRQDPLNYGIRINNRLAFLLADQQRGDFPPTDQAEEVRLAVSKELDVELNKLNQLTKSCICTVYMYT